MSTSSKTHLPCHEAPARLPAAARHLAVGLMAMGLFTSPPSEASGDALGALQCTLAVETVGPAGDRTPHLQATLRNASALTVRLLRWGTPFEGVWRAPLVQIERDGQPLDYLGPMVKRRAPQPNDHLTLRPGQSLQVSLPLSPVWAVDAPGRYRISAHWMWHGQVRDARRTTTTLPPTEARCTPVEFTRP